MDLGVPSELIIFSFILFLDSQLNSVAYQFFKQWHLDDVISFFLRFVKVWPYTSFNRCIWRIKCDPISILIFVFYVESVYSFLVITVIPPLIENGNCSLGLIPFLFYPPLRSDFISLTIVCTSQRI